MKIVDVLKQSGFYTKRMSVLAWILALSGLFAPSRAHALTTVNTYTDGDGIVWHMSANSGEEPTWNSIWVKRQGVAHITKMVLKEKHKSVSIPSTLPWDSGGSGDTAHPTIEYMSTDATDEHPWLESVGVNDLVMLKIPCFKNCPVLKSFKMDTVNPVDGRYAVESGVLFSKDFTSLKKYPEGKDGEEYSVPSAVTELMDSCFANTKLCRIRFLGNAPQTVADNVFSGSDSLAYVYYSQGASGWSSTFKGKPAYAMPKAVTGVSASQGTSASAITITWSENAVATNYKIYRSESTSGSKILLGTVSGSTLYSDTSASADRKYYYTVVAVNGPVTGSSSSAATGWLKGLTYTITYRPGSSGSGSVLTQSKPHGTSVTLKGATYTRSGYTQTGWATSDGGSQVYALGGTCSVNDSITLYPVWTAQRYTVVFHANGGSGTMSDQVIFTGVSTTLSPNAFTRSGYTFAGWSVASNGLVSYADKASVTDLVAAGLTIGLYAIWTPVPDTYMIVFDANGDARGMMESQTIRCGVRTSLSPNSFSMIGGAFVGWSRTPGGQAEFADQASVLDLAGKGGSITLYAVWTYHYTVIFDANGGSGVMANQSIWWDTNYYISGNPGTTLRGNEFTKSGYQFAGWARTPDGAVAYSDCGKVYNIAGPGETVTLYAVWTAAPTTYTVSFSANGGTGTMTSQTITYGVSTSLKANTFTKSGYTFAGWSKTAGGSVAYANGASVSNLASAGGSITLYAVWTPQVVAPSAPTGVSATDGSYADYARVTWSAASGATSYNLYRSTTTSRPSTATKTGVTSPYNDTTATPGTKYYYWIAAVNSAGASYSSYDTGYRAVSLTLDKTTSQYALPGGSGSVTVKANTSWSASANVSWITLGTKSANGNGTLTYTVAANTSSSSRSGTITVTAGSGTSYPVVKTIAVSQEEVSDFVIADGVLTKYTGVGGSVTIPLGVTSIGYQAFDGCTGLTSVVIPEGVADIGDNAFYGCYKMTSVTMPSSLKSIGSTAFSYCLGLTSVTIPSGVKSIGYDVFDRCNKLISIDVAAGNAYYSSQDGVLFNKDMSELCIFPPGRSGAYTIPSGVESVGSFAFATCSSLISVSMPSGLKKIGNRAFEGCEWLTSVTMPSSVTNIGSWAFVWCNGLTTVTIPPGVTSIKDYTFSGCSGLATVTIPSSVKEIMSNAFNNCPLKVVHVSHNGEIDTVKQMFTASGFVTSGVTFDIVETTTYKVVFDAQGGVTDWTTVEICDGLPVGELPTPRRSGYKFLGWFTTANEGTRVSATTIVTSNVTYYAHWVMETTYYVTFNANGGMGTMDVQPIIYGISTTLDENGYVKSGYTFSGWATMADGEVVYANRASVFNLTTVGEAITLYAVWKIKTCTIIFNANGGTGSMESQILTYGVNAAIKANEFTRNGYAFAGWATTSGGAVKYENCMVVGVDDKTRESVTLYAVWRARTCSVTFNANGGTGVMVRQTFTYGVEVTLNANQFTRGGYTFVGWAMTEEGKSVCADRASVSCLVVADDSITLYAVWEKLVVPAPSVSPADGATFSTDSCLVTLDCAMEGASIYYTTNGATPKTSASYLYTQPFEIRGTVNVKAVAVKDGVKSEYVTAKITKVDPVPVETPVITPVHGTTFSTDSCEVTITCPTDGATIYYTTDGTLPTVSESCRYKGAFSITDTATIKAIAVKEGWLDSACATVTITKVGLTLEGVLGVDSRVRVTTGGEADWVPVNDANAKEGGTSARSGLGNADDDSVSWIQLSVNGKGTLSFWCKTSCEHDDDNTYTWDRVEVMVDGQAKSDWYMDGTSQWVQRTIAFDTVAEHTVRIAYIKDESDYDGEDCAWLDGVVWTPVGAAPGSLPDLGDTPSATDVSAAVADAADPQVAAKVDAANYNDFRVWAGKVKAKGGSAAGVQGVMSAENAWLSYALGQDTLLETVPADGDLAVEAFEPMAKTGTFEFTVSVKDVEVGSEAVKENLKKVFGLEGAATLDKAAFSSDKVEIDFSTPVDGKVKFTATPKDASARAFFMRVKMLP